MRLFAVVRRCALAATLSVQFCCAAMADLVGIATIESSIRGRSFVLEVDGVARLTSLQNSSTSYDGTASLMTDSVVHSGYDLFFPSLSTTRAFTVATGPFTTAEFVITLNQSSVRAQLNSEVTLPFTGFSVDQINTAGLAITDWTITAPQSAWSIQGPNSLVTGNYTETPWSNPLGILSNVDVTRDAGGAVTEFEIRGGPTTTVPENVLFQGQVDGFDVRIWTSLGAGMATKLSWPASGATPPGVPEPSSVGPLALAAGLILRRRRRAA